MAFADLNKAKFTLAELQAYEKARDEIQQVLEIAATRWAEGRAEGETAALARAILALLAARGIAVSVEARARVEACKDVSTLDRWVILAATARAADEVLADP